MIEMQQSISNLGIQLLAPRNLHKTNTVSGMAMVMNPSHADSSTLDHTSRTPLYQGTRFSLMNGADHIGAVKRAALDANDVKFDFGKLIFDENDKIEKQMKQKAKAEDQKLDPFMREFLKRTKNEDIKSEKVSATYFHQRNRSVQMMPAGTLPEKI